MHNDNWPLETLNRPPSALDEVVGRNLAQARRARGMPAAALARVMGVAPSELVEIEAGRRRLSAAAMFAAWRTLNLTVARLHKF